MARPGIALALALMVLLLIEVMTAGLLTLTTHERLVSASHARAVRAEAAAEMAAAAVFAEWRAGGFDTLPVGTRVVAASGSGGFGDLSYDATVERLLSGAYLVRAGGRVGGPTAYATARVVALGRTLDSYQALIQSNNAIVARGPAILAGETRVDASLGILPVTWSDTLCPATDPLPLPAALRGARQPLIAESVMLSDPPVIDTTLVQSDSIALGGVKWSEIESIADRVESGVVYPAPAASDNRCVTEAPGNWGDPYHQGTACGSYFPMIFSNGDLNVSGGVGQGILVVRGVLTLSDGASFVGIVVARDGISLEPGTRVDGSIESKGGYALFDGTTVHHSRCAIARSLSLSPSAHRLVLQQQRFIRAF